MSLPFIIRPLARTDIDAAYDWYEAQQLGRGDEFLVELYERIHDVCETPELYGRVLRKTRAARLHRSKYIIYYRIEMNRVIVSAVQHARVHPDRWKRR